MAKYTDINSFFSVDWPDLLPEKIISFQVFLFFSKSQHILLWKASGDLITGALIEQYKAKGLDKVWILKTEREAYLAYLHSHGHPVPDSAIAPTPKPKTPEGALIAEVLKEPELTDAQKQAIVAAKAQQILQEVAQAKSEDQKQSINEKARDIVRDILQSANSEAKNLLDEILQLADVDPDITHAINVSTYSVIFAMAFGKISDDLICDIALAGLLHDVGMVKVPMHISQKPWNQMSAQDKKRYESHVEAGQALIQGIGTNASERALMIMQQQHEKFDGSGFPKKLKGFEFDDVAQLVAMAELTDSIGSAQWDDQTRTLSESFDLLDSMDQKRSFPEFFNPDIFGRVIKWFRSSEGAESFKTASQVVQTQLKNVVEDDAA